jgi:hypothetical protein
MGRVPQDIPSSDGPAPRSIPLDPELEKRLAEARQEAAQHGGHERRAPRPDRLQR